MVALAPFNLHVLALGMLPAGFGGFAEGEERLFFWLCKLLETGLESVPLSILTLSVLFKSEEAGDGLLWSSLGLSALSMAYGFYGMCAYSQSAGGREQLERPGADRLAGCRFRAFLSILVHVCWTLAALGACCSGVDTVLWLCRRACGAAG